MIDRAVACTISRPVRDLLHDGPFVGQVLAVFEHACDLVNQEGDVIALVTPVVGDGPLNIVVQGTAGLFFTIGPAAPVTLCEDGLVVGELQVDLAEAAIWEPRPDWDALRAQRAAIASRLSLLRRLCLRRAPARSLLALVAAPRPSDRLEKATFSTAYTAAAALREGWKGGPGRLQVGVAGLTGLGGGLTPAGDDFLTGVMLWTWLAHPSPAPLCRAIAQVAVPRTTILSGALLRAAACGQCSAAWQRLLAALSDGQETGIATAVDRILAHGATSGADSLSGFLYLGL